MPCCINKPPKFRDIPKSKIPEGIERCKDNIIDFLNDARAVLTKGKRYHAYVSFEFALEEFGKIRMLKDALGDSDTVSVNAKVFTSHEGKCEKALAILGSNFQTVFDGVWVKGMWAPNIWPEETVVSHKTRLKCAFVDFVNGNWIIGADIDKIKLENLINELERRTKLE
jgi:AbiV family abortive infection protein